MAPNGGHRAGFMPPSASFPGCDPGEAVGLHLLPSVAPWSPSCSKPHSLSQPHLRSSGPREAPGSLSREQFALSIPDIFPYFVHLPPWSMSSEREDLVCLSARALSVLRAQQLKEKVGGSIPPRASSAVGALLTWGILKYLCFSFLFFFKETLCPMWDSNSGPRDQ